MKRLLLLGIATFILGSYIQNTNSQRGQAECAFLHQYQTSQLLNVAQIDVETATNRISEIYAVNPSMIEPIQFVGSPFRSYVWNDGTTQHRADFDQNGVVLIYTGWNEPQLMQIHELLSCLGTPKYYTEPNYTMTSGFMATGLIYDGPDLLLVIKFGEDEDLRSPDTLVEVSYIRNTRESNLRDFIRYAYDVNDTEQITEFQDELHSWPTSE